VSAATRKVVFADMRKACANASTHLWLFITPYTCNTTQKKCALKL